jgi:TRAP-type C4-dicarboxylate transport system permease small subunit
LLNRINSLLEKFGRMSHRSVMVSVYPAMVIVITLDVILRYCFNAPLAWSQDATGLLLLIAFFGSLQLCWNEKRNMRMSIIYDHFRGIWRKAADILASLAGMLFFGMLGYQCLKDIPAMISTSETGMLVKIPFWPFKVLIFIISALIFFKLVLGILALSPKTMKSKDE